MLHTAQLLEGLGISHGFSTAAEGDFQRERLPERVSVARQIHGTHSIWAAVPGRLPGRLEEEADAVLCRTGSGAGILTADCVPILIVDPLVSLGAAVHAGWRGTLAGVAEAAVKALAEAGAQPGRMSAAIGPCIRACCYEVSDDLLSGFTHRFGPQVARPVRRLDLALANRQQLAACGISDNKIEDLEECTHCALEGAKPRYFSHRREGSGGRQLSWLRFGA